MADTAPHPDAVLETINGLEVWKWHNAEGVLQLELTGVGCLEEYEAAAKAGEFVDADHYAIIATDDVDIYTPRTQDVLAMFEAEDTPEDRLLVSFRKGVIPLDLVNEAAEKLRSAAVKTDNRGLAGGPIDEKLLRSNAQGGKLVPIGNRKTRVRYLLPDGSVGTTDVANKVMSGLVGNFDADKRHPFCRPTSWTKNNPSRMPCAIRLMEKMSECYRRQAPVRWQRQMDYCLQHELPEKGWMIGRSVYTTMSIQRNFRTATHQDAGDLPEGFGSLAAYSGAPYEGGYTGFPRYRVAVDARSGDFMTFDIHEWHGNTAMDAVNPLEEGEVRDHWNPGYERMSFVCFVRSKMRECGSVEEEHEKYQAWYAKFKPPKEKAKANKAKRDLEKELADREMEELQHLYSPSE